jgi:putative spermidine/putrescine transport system substrate-binding protein
MAKLTQSLPRALGSRRSPERDHLLSRRDFLGAISGSAMGLVATTILGPSSKAANKFDGRRVVFASWGGAYQDAERDCYCLPFAEKSGATVVQDGPVWLAKFRAMAESGSPIWDVVDVTDTMLYDSGGAGLLEKIDRSAVDVSRIKPDFVDEFGIANVVLSYNIGYSTKVYGPDNHPRSWADVFDTKRFPGKRMLSNDPQPNMEIALLADGVAPDKLYPLDVERAFKKLDTIKNDLIFWTSSSQAQQLLTDGEVVCGNITNGRAYDAAKKGAKVAVEWNQHIQSVQYLVVPKGAKNVDVAMGLIDEMTKAENQAKLANLIAYAPTNPAAFSAINEDIAPWLCTNPKNADKGFVINAKYWRTILKPLNERFQLWKLS